jgi:phosphatidylserine/phosphatidylglycerophosphate/cardiolipin synthase-like enzyme
MNPLLALGASELRALAAAASGGRLNPATPGLVGRFVSDGPAVSRALGELAASGTTLASTLELLAEAAERRSSVEDLVELVLTGPNTGTGRDTGVVVRQLFREARTSVWVCGYKLYNARDLFVDLARPELRVRMLLDLGEAEGQSEEAAVRRFLDDFHRWHWPEGHALPDIWYDPLSLLPHGEHRAVAHAKCVVADGQRLFVSSANFTEAAQNRNIEAGLLVESETLAVRMVEFLEGLIREQRVRPAWLEAVTGPPAT